MATEDLIEDLAGLDCSLTLTGTGTSMGVPMIACDCAVCTSNDSRDNRLRSGVYVRNGDSGFLIDTGPELRQQMVRTRVKTISGVVYTHAHADHIMGLDDLRIFCFRQKQSIPLFCEERVELALRKTFAYVFEEGETLHSRPQLNFRRISEEPFELCGLPVQPIRLMHGHLPVFGYRIRDVAFCTDVSEIPESSWKHLENLRVLILGAIRDEPHPTHFTVGQALEVVDRCGPLQTYLTHISHSLPHEATNARLPKHVQLAHDGLTISLE
ncbi:MBL fold metallo-hydrolase [Planctomicrobium sp. SH661]|uniref:MBL fold metallo-hydrolase n=1 Tax=Planctomicrobium sp. SH661 TaxID=3448124 RepID=UPI003F5B31F3